MSQVSTPSLPPQLKVVPGPKGLPVAGVAFSFLRSPLGYMQSMLTKFGRMYQLPLGPSKVILLHDAEAVEKVLRLDFENFGMSQLQERLLEPLLGQSMPVVANHGYWEELHAIMLPLFTPRMLRHYFLGTLAAIQDEVGKLSELQGQGKPVPMLDFVRHGVFDALTRTLFIRGLDHDEKAALLQWFTSSDAYINARNLSGGSKLINWLPKVREGKRCLKRIDERVYELVAYRKANRIDEAADMLDVLIAARKPDGAPLNDKELRDNVIALLFGGQETTPSVITWAFGLLAANPEKRTLMLEEIDNVLAGRAPQFEDLAKLEYTEMVLEEALRLYPPFPFIGREATTDTSLEGYEIKKGNALGFVGWTIHRDPRYWPEPERFVPERHTKEAKKLRAKCSFLSFGYGQRRCIGERVARMEGVLMLAVVSQHFLLEHVDGQLPAPHVQMSIKPVGGMPMRIITRDIA